MQSQQHKYMETKCQDNVQIVTKLITDTCMIVLCVCS